MRETLLDRYKDAILYSHPVTDFDDIPDSKYRHVYDAIVAESIVR